METTRSLTSQLLIAMPGMQDPNFSNTVTLVCEHNGDGALGIIINRPLSLNLGGLLEQLELDAPNATVGEAPVLAGGPVGTERGFVLHNAEQDFENSLNVSNDIKLTVSRDILDAMASGDGPAKSLVALGYAGWEAGQLEDEMLANAWLNVPATASLVFDTPFEKRWAEAADSLGIDLSRMGPGAGHA
ncbi:MAG: YqgE/AlgH family protein [Pseudomonadota bacterium]